MYLGACISNSAICNQIEAQLQQKYSHQVKFSSFLTKNSDWTFTIKKTVWDSVFKSAIYYGCETWLTKSIQFIERPYMKTSTRNSPNNLHRHITIKIGDARRMVKDR